MLRKSSPSHNHGCFTQIANKVVTEVEGHSILIGMKPSNDKNNISFNSCSLIFSVSALYFHNNTRTDL